MTAQDDDLNIARVPLDVFTQSRDAVSIDYLEELESVMHRSRVSRRLTCVELLEPPWSSQILATRGLALLLVDLEINLRVLPLGDVTRHNEIPTVSVTLRLAIDEDEHRQTGTDEAMGSEVNLEGSRFHWD